jgi:hypothetical protein
MPTSAQLAAASQHRISQASQVSQNEKHVAHSAHVNAGLPKSIRGEEVQGPPKSAQHSSKSIQGGAQINVEKKKRAREESEEDEEEDPYDEDEEESEDDDEDDSIVVGDEEVKEENLPDDEDDPENARIITKVLVEEASQFIKKPLETSCIGGRSLRDRSKIMQPKEKLERDRIVAEAYELDEKKELIKELNIWKRKLSKEALEAKIVWPQLKTSMKLSEIKDEHDKVRKGLGLESSDDEESEEEEE